MSQNSGAGCSTSGVQLSKKRALSTEEDQNKPSKSKKFEQIDDIFKHYTTINEFCISGEFELNETTSNFFYKSSDGNAHFSIDVLNISEKDVDMLAKNCSSSPFGMGTQSVVDLTVRQAKELRAKYFAFQFNPNMKNSITSQIKKLLSGREFFIEPYKLNIYPEGGHFKKHKDTLKNHKMIASLVMCLPNPFEGGILTVENDRGQSIDFDWGKEIITESSTESNKIRWACFFCSCDHAISKVTKGNRITIAYDIFKDDTTEDDDNPDGNDEITSIPEKYRSKCSEYLENFIIKELDPNVVYGYFPNHVYSFSDMKADKDKEGEKDLKKNLKGNDLLLYDVLNEHGWNVLLQVYYPDVEWYGPKVDFYTPPNCESYYSMESAIRKADRDKLGKISSLQLLNSVYNCKKEEIYDYEYNSGFTGNSPVGAWETFYAGTIMIIRHQSKSEEKKEPVEEQK